MNRFAPSWFSLPAAVLFLLSASACGGGDGAEEAPAGTPLDLTVTVDAALSVAEKVETYIDAVGSLEAAEDVLVSAETQCLVKAIRFEEGAPVKQGQVLVLLDDEMVRLEREQAGKRLDRMKATLLRMEAEVRRNEALVENAKSNFERKKTLLEQDATTQAVFVEAKTTLDSALAALDEAEAAVEESRRSILESESALKLVDERLEDCTVTAPFDGILGERFVGPGDFVDEGDGLVRLITADPLKASFTVPERYRGRLTLDQSIHLTVEAWPDRTFEGRVIYIAPSLDPDTRSVKVKARVGNESGLLQPGFFCRVQLVVDARAEAVVIPEEAVIPRGDRFFVYTVEEGKAVLKEVFLGQRKAGRVEILKGLEAGEQVITAGQQRVADGFPVKVRSAGGAAAAGAAGEEE